MVSKSIRWIMLIVAFSSQISALESKYPSSLYSLGMGNSNFGAYLFGMIYYNPSFLAWNKGRMLWFNTGIQDYDLRSNNFNHNWNHTDIQSSFAYIKKKIGISAIYRQHGDRKTLLPLDDPHPLSIKYDFKKSKDLNHEYFLFIFYGKSVHPNLAVGVVNKLHYAEPELIINEINYRNNKLSFSIDISTYYRLLNRCAILFLVQNILSYSGYYSVYDHYNDYEFKELPVNIQMSVLYLLSKNMNVFTTIGLEPVYFYNNVKDYPRNDSFHLVFQYKLNHMCRAFLGYQLRRTIRNFYYNYKKYVYHSLHGFSFGVDIHVKKMNVIISVLTNDRNNYYKDKNIDVKGSTFNYALSIGHIF